MQFPILLDSYIASYSTSKKKKKHVASLIFIYLFSYRVYIKYCVFFLRILESLTSLPLQHSAAIGCTKHYHQYVFLYTRIALRALQVSYSGVGEGGVAVNCKK